jgi:hypothetical protein
MAISMAQDQTQAQGNEGNYRFALVSLTSFFSCGVLLLASMIF